MAAIFDLQHTQTLDSIPTSFFVLLDPDNMGIAVGIVFLYHIWARYAYFRFGGGHLGIPYSRLGRAMFLIVLLDS